MVSVEQIKGPEEVRERIVAAARAARQGPECPPELSPEYNPSQHPLCDHLIHYHEHHISHNGIIHIVCNYPTILHVFIYMRT